MVLAVPVANVIIRDRLNPGATLEPGMVFTDLIRGEFQKNIWTI